jgi:hypothetical protein
MGKKKKEETFPAPHVGNGSKDSMKSYYVQGIGGKYISSTYPWMNESLVD